ncbi:MAG: hypothetical protein GWP61_19500 [Chloroflexi bacterium]|jgi:hypothetical protein|nr:hypothetical protein [Chloroflexota bacterium]
MSTGGSTNVTCKPALEFVLVKMTTQAIVKRTTERIMIALFFTMTIPTTFFYYLQSRAAARYLLEDITAPIIGDDQKKRVILATINSDEKLA